MTVHYFNRFADGDDMSAFDVAFLTALRGQRDKLVENLENAAAAQYNLTPEPYGGFRRTLTGVLATGTDASKVFVMDDEMDWRDRMLFIVGPSSLSALASFYPGHEDDAVVNDGSAIGLLTARCYYTGSGYADPGGSPGNNYHKLFASDQLQLYCSTGGELRVEITGASAQLGFFAQVYASPKMNARSASIGTTYVTTPTLFDALDGAAVEPHDVNNIQDAVHMDQMKGADSFPVGSVGRGDPLLPYEWTVRGETVRQRLTEPALRRYFSATMPIDEKLLLDDSFDWRDRFVWASGVFSVTVDRRPGETSDAGNGSGSTADAVPTFFAGYTGDGDDGSDHAAAQRRYTLRQLAGLAPFFLYADQDTGHLYVSTFDPSPGSGTNSDVDTINLVICASPRVGPRSRGIGPDFLEPELPAKKVNATLIDSANSDMTNIVARYRMDRGIVLDNGKVAVIADLSGNGHHLRQLDPSLRASAPSVRTSLNSAVGIGVNGTEYYESVKKLPASLAGYHVAVICEPLSAVATFDMWKPMLALSTEGQISGLITGTTIDAQWVPNTAASPAYRRRESSATYLGGVGMAIEWNFGIDADPTRLSPDINARAAGGAVQTATLVSTSPAATGLADVQSLVWRLFEGFHGYVCEVIVCDAAQAATDDFITSADIVTRYGL